MPTVLVTGANRGLGLEFVRQYAADGWKIIATVRDPREAGEVREVAGDVRVEALDMSDHRAVMSAGQQIGAEPLDLVIANAGTWGPEQMETAEDAEAWIETLAVNSMAPVLLGKAFRHNLAATNGKFVAITSRMGSIADNQSGGYIAYRSSKAALNAALKSLSIDWAGDGITVAALHPGWVQTRMGGPSAPLTPEESVTGMRRVIDGLTRGQSGSFLEYSGAAIPW